MEKLPKLGEYDGKGDPDKHVHLSNEWLNYLSVDDTSKCKLFPLTLIELSRLWFNFLSDESILSCTDFCEQFSTRFTAWKRQPMREIALNKTVHGKN